jgi:hypothetical protein
MFKAITGANRYPLRNFAMPDNVYIIYMIIIQYAI